MRGVLTRDVSGHWLDEVLRAGKIVYRWSGYDYAIIGPGGVAVSDKPDEYPFYEIPADAVQWETTT